ncbi:MAG: DUF1549 domain-containing protein, partial [Gemmataceae bacterium]|nr:DUF1549 domain-containing protein [Gemmataceae bacterium]
MRSDLRGDLQRCGIAAAFVAFLGLLAAVPAWAGDDPVEYNRDIRPILANNCFNCHGPATKKAGLRLDDRDSAVKPAASNAVPIVPGRPEASELIRRVFAAAPETVMPPPSSHKTLKPAEKELLRKWIAQGAKYQKHWSFEPPTKSAVPQVAGVASNNPIDAFLADRLRREGLKFSPEAEPHILVRRVAFALTGLPPTPAEVDQFLQDRAATTPEAAYQRLVERYLASPHYGEEMARHWLDLARYADTHGLHLDNERQMWLYRDWVIRAYNDNMPFDRFTHEQLAGDLLPNATSEQLIATGFNRCNVTTSEGGSIDAEWVYRNAVDRTTTVIETWLALTGGCCVCHDHKFDPLTMKDYYAMFAFFYSADGPALDGNALLTAPFLKRPTPAQEKRLAELNEQLAAAQQELARKRQECQYVDPAEAGPEAAKFAADPAQSFRAWLQSQRSNQGPGLPKEIVALLKQPKLEAEQQARLRNY